MAYTSGPLTQEQASILQIADTQTLAAVARGEVDLNRIAREELASRGMDQNGNWVGFDKARQQLLG